MKYPLKQVSHFTDGQDQRRLGLRVTCPNCGEDLKLWFRNPIGGGAPSPAPAFERYTRTGDTLRTLTLTPAFEATGHFHSIIVEGVLDIDSPFECAHWQEVHR